MKFNNFNNINELANFELLKMFRLGSYRMRQYEFSITDPVPFILTGIEELVTGVGE